MNFSEKIDAFHSLGEFLSDTTNPQIVEIVKQASSSNGWFTEDNVKLSMRGIQNFLDKKKLENWIGKYDIKENQPLKKIGLVMAGNIPMVGFHDFLCVLLSGNIVKAKISSNDNVLIPFLAKKLIETHHGFEELIHFPTTLKGIDAAIATGSDNSSRYFDYYFSKYPHIIRKNRSSCAIIDGTESSGDFIQLGKDIFQYFGLGCRNISKLFVPKGYNFEKMLAPLEQFSGVASNHKYRNNYDYNKSIYLVNKVPHYDNGFLLLTESNQFVSPISVLYYEHYDDDGHLASIIDPKKEKVQCIVSKDGAYAGSLTFGQTQLPELGDYADNIDTMEFLSRLH